MTARAPAVQTSFAAGMLDPQLAARTDVAAYGNGGRDLTNVVGLPQGGVTLRGGLAYFAEIAEGGANARLLRFEFSTEQVYLMVLRPLAIDVYLPDGTLCATVATTYAADEIAAVQWVQSLDTLILVHPDHVPGRLVRSGSHAAWVLSDLAFTDAPTYAFGNATTGAATPSGTGGSVTVTSTAADFADAEPGWKVVIDSGQITVTAVNSATQVTGTVGDDTLDDTAAAAAGEWTLEEPVWSETRGWPSSVFLHQGRLYFGGSKSRPQTIWGSRAGKFFDFGWTSDALDDEAVELTLDNDRVCAVRHLYSLNTLFAFTSGGMFSRTSAEVITPGDFVFARSSEVPAAAIRPAELDGSVMFISGADAGQHRTLYEAVYDYNIDAYRADDVAILSESLLRTPVDMAARLGNEANAANHLFVVNGDDGTVAVLNSRKVQKMTGWTLLATGGCVRAVAVAGGVPYFLVERVVAGATRYFIERLDADRSLDCGLFLTAARATDTWNGLDHLEGATLDLIGDGVPLGRAVVSGGTVTTPYAVATLEAGFAFDWAVETMPVEIGLADGTLIGNRHRLTKATIRVRDTAGISVNGRRIPDRFVGGGLLDGTAVRFTGQRVVRLLGWKGGRLSAEGATVRITGTSVNPASILSVVAEVAA